MKKIIIPIVILVLILVGAGATYMFTIGGYRLNLTAFSSKHDKAIEMLKKKYDYIMEYDKENKIIYMIEYTDTGDFLLSTVEGGFDEGYKELVEKATDLKSDCVQADKIVRQIDDDFRVRYLLTSEDSRSESLRTKSAHLLVDSTGTLKFLEDFVED